MKNDSWGERGYLLISLHLTCFLLICGNTQLRGHNLKLKNPRANKSVRANSLDLRNIPVWNSLPTYTVYSKTVVEFKPVLDIVWQDRRYDMADIY